jgi:hypothetical protein
MNWTQPAALRCKAGSKASVWWASRVTMTRSYVADTLDAGALAFDVDDGLVARQLRQPR